jgi:hypothetical protein
MPGHRVANNKSFLSPLAGYRLGVTGADATGATGLAALTGSTGYFSCSDTKYAGEMQLNLYVDVRDETQPDGHPLTLAKTRFRVYCCPHTTLDSSTSWYLVDDVSFQEEGTLWQLENAPPGVYKVLFLTLGSTSADVYYEYRK